MPRPLLTEVCLRLSLPPPAQCGIPTGYASTLSLLNDNYVFYWTLSSSNTTIDAAITAKTSGWVGWGVSQAGTPQMPGSEAVVGHSTRGTAQSYRLNGRDASLFQDISSQVPLSNTSACTYSSGGSTWTLVKFTRSLTGGNNAMSLTSTVPMVAAYGSSTTLNQHASDSRTTFSANLFTGSGTVSNAVPNGYRIAHGALMFIGFSFFLPFGVFVSRYTRSLIGENWFILHIVSQLAGYFIAFAGFVIALWMVKGQHFKTKAHAQFGISIIVAGVVQIAIGFFRPHVTPLGEKRTRVRFAWEIIHRCLGLLIVVVAFVTVFLGLGQYGAHYGWFIGYAIYVALWLVGGIILEVRLRANARKPTII